MKMHQETISNTTISEAFFIDSSSPACHDIVEEVSTIQFLELKHESLTY